jgi:hypothetical protein
VRRARAARAVLRLAVALGALAAWAGGAAAHGVGMSDLVLRVDGAHLEGDWQLNVRDARRLLGMDPGAGGEGAWLELRAHEPALRESLAHALAMKADGRPFAFGFTPAPLAWEREFDNVKLHLAATAPAPPVHLELRCDLLFARDPAHRAYFSVEDSRVTSVGAFRTDLRVVTLDIRQFHFLDVLVEFAREGLWHIWTGLDHMLFVIALLLPATLVRTGGDWAPREGLWPSTREVLKVVTAFTVAHSLTLALSFFGVVRPPSQWVEVGIALSVFAAAWNNLRPFLPGRAWVMAMAFGLVHGMGFAGALSNLSLPRGAHLLALGAFNVGVEIGQLTVVGATMPLLYLGSRRRLYPRLIMGAGSLAIAWFAMLWVLQRAFGLEFFARG